MGHDGRAWCVECLTMVVQLEERGAFVVRSRWNNEKTMVFGSKPLKVSGERVKGYEKKP